MHPRPRRTLRQLLTYYGPALLDEPARLDALLADLCGPYHRERFLLVHALRERIPAELLAQPQGGAVHGRRLAQRLQRRYGFSAEAAQWAIESWALALNIAPLTSRLPHPLAALVWFLQRAIPLPQIRAATLASPASANRRNRVQYRNHAGLFLPGRVWLTVTVLIAILASGIVLAEPLRELRLPFQRTDADTDTWQMPSAERVHALLLAAFPLPQEARIETELSATAVRQSPALESPLAGTVGAQGQMVTVDSFSADGRWAHISSPVEGWISNDFASFAARNSDTRLFIRPAVSRIQVPGSKVFAGPTGSETELATLVADQIVIVLGITTDGSRLRIAAPLAGWIDSTAAQP